MESYLGQLLHKFFQTIFIGLTGCLFLISANAQTLPALINTAITTHPIARTQRALVESAQAGVDSARWQFFPTPSVAVENASTNSTDTGYQGDATVSTLRLQQPLWTGGRLTAGLDKAQANVSVSQAARDEAKLQLALRVVQTYSEWLGSHLKQKTYQKSLYTHRRLSEQVQRRIEQGVSAERQSNFFSVNSANWF